MSSARVAEQDPVGLARTLTIFTVGHSTRTIDEFLEIVVAHRLELIVDVRKLPGSRRFPHFNADALGAALAARGVSFDRLEPLTGRRPVSATVPFEVNAWWQNRSFHNYADHACSPEFRDALAQLLAWADERRVAVMCSEAVWWRCHRRIIADHLLTSGTTARPIEVRHIMSADSAVRAELSEGAVLEHAAFPSVTYPATPTS